MKQLHLRYLLLDSKTGYSSKYHSLSAIAKSFGEYKISCIFVTLVPAKPLNNAQIGGAFYFIFMGPFKKKYSSPDVLPFLSIPKTDHQFKPGTTFDNVLDLYRFDKKLRVLLFNEIEKIEIAFREAVANVAAEMTGDIFWITNPIHFKNSNVYAKTFSLIKSEYSKSTEDFIKHFNATYSEPFAPAWMISEIIPFGTTLQLYKNLSDQRIRKQIARQFYLQPQALESWITTLALTRNACCHHSRVWNKVNLIIPADAKKMSRPWLLLPTVKDRVYFNICIIAYFLNIISPNNDFKGKLLALFKHFPQIDLRAMGFPSGWENEPLWKQR